MRENSNSTGLSKDLGEGLSDRKSISEAEESEVGMVESRILPNQIEEAIKSTWRLVNKHYYTCLFDENRTEMIGLI
jgi:hypothetical protein